MSAPEKGPIQPSDAPLIVTPDGRAHKRCPDEHGNDYITFGDGTGAVHTEDGWFMVEEGDE